MATINAKTIEGQFRDYFNKLVYAGLKDNDIGSEKPSPYSPMSWQSYDNILKEKKDRADGVKSRFTLAEPCKQFLTFLFSKMIEELKNIVMVEGDDVKAIRVKLELANAECYTEFMFGLAETLRNEFGETLKSAGDPTRWFANQIIGFLPLYSTKPVLTALIAQEFDEFLKALAWLFSKLLAYYEVSISGELFLGTLAQQGMSQIMLDTVQSCLRAKPAAKPRAKKAVVSNTPASTEAPTPTTTETPVNTSVVNVQPEATSVKHDELDDMLMNV